MPTQLTALLSYSFYYDSDAQRDAHVALMQAAGFTVGGPRRRSDDPFFGEKPRVFKPYAEYQKQAEDCDVVIPDVPGEQEVSP